MVRWLMNQYLLVDWRHSSINWVIIVMQKIDIIKLTINWGHGLLNQLRVGKQIECWKVCIWIVQGRNQRTTKSVQFYTLYHCALILSLFYFFSCLILNLVRSVWDFLVNKKFFEKEKNNGLWCDSLMSHRYKIKAM